jgi:hypothetical protein
MQRDRGLDASVLIRVEVAAVGEVLGRGPGLIAGPGLEGGHELARADQTVLYSEQWRKRLEVRHAIRQIIRGDVGSQCLSISFYAAFSLYALATSLHASPEGLNLKTFAEEIGRLSSNAFAALQRENSPVTFFANLSLFHWR